MKSWKRLKAFVQRVRNLRICLAAVVALMTITVASDVAAGPPPKSEPPPALTVGSSPPLSFVVTGVTRLSKNTGLAFRVATDGRRQTCVVYDPADGTPLLISDGAQTLVYDVAKGRIVRLPTSRASVQVNWDAAENLPFRFGIGVGYPIDPQKPGEGSSWFRIDRFVVASGDTLKWISAANGVELWAAQRPSGGIEALQKDLRDTSWFRFVSFHKDQDFYRFEMVATHIGQQLPDSALVFPDLARLAQDIPITDLDQELLPTFLVILRDGRLWMAKLALSAGPEANDLRSKAIPNADWDELGRRDAVFGQQYRAALARQGISFQEEKVNEKTQSSR